MRSRCGADASSAADPPVGLRSREVRSPGSTTMPVTFYRRQLPHLDSIGQPVFLTWHLYGSLPPIGAFSEAASLPDRLRSPGPVTWMRPAPAPSIFANPLRTPSPFCQITSTYCHAAGCSCRTNEIAKRNHRQTSEPDLGRTGTAFWQEESNDRVVRDYRELSGSGATSSRTLSGQAWRRKRARIAGRAQDRRPRGRPRTSYFPAQNS